MKIFVSPSKTFKDTQIDYQTIPVFKSMSEILLNTLKDFTVDSLKVGFRVSDKLASHIYENIHANKSLFPAVHLYDGIFFKSLNASNLDLTNETLCILSAYYGMLKPFDGIYPYRLDFNQSLLPGLYAYWKEHIHLEISKMDDALMIDLTSLEYSKLLPNDTRIYRINFLSDKPLSSVESKKMRGLFARYLLKNQITSLDQIISIDINGYSYDQTLSHDQNIVFKKNQQ